VKVDVAVLGGGPGGYTSAIRAAQLGASVACIERAPELGGTCLRVGCIPTKAWVQTAFALKQVEETFDKVGVTTTGSHLEFSKANEWKSAVVKQMTQGVAFLFKANGVEWVRGTGTFTDANTIAVEGGEDVTFTSAIVATGSFPLRPPIEGLDSDRCVDSEGLLAQTEVPKRLVILGGGVIGCEFASIFRRFGSEVTIIEALPSLIPQEDDDASTELAKQFSKRGITLHLEKHCTKVDDSGLELTVHFGDGESVTADLMLVSVGRTPLVEGLGLEGIGVEFDGRTGITTDGHRRTTVPHIYAVGDCAGHWQLAHTAFREGAVAAENACGHDSSVDNRAVPRPIYTDPEIASVGLTEAAAREKYGDAVATGVFPWVANARAVMQNETVGWVKSIHETPDGELLGLVMVGPHVTDLVEAGVIAIDANANVETVADGMAAHPTLAEAIKEACLLALGRPIHAPNRKRRADMAEAINPNDLRYHQEHAWVRTQGDEATFGITWFAQDALQEVVFFDSPKVGDTVTKDRAYAHVESAKAVSDVIAPMSGEIVEVNDALDSAPETINEDPYGQGWMVKVKLSDPSEAGPLMSAEEYSAMVE
jgi:dihydrolipoamide dehydrogenase